MKVIVLGANGFIGSWVVRALVSAGHQVDALVRDSSDTWRIDELSSVHIVRSTDWAASVLTSAPDAAILLDWQGVSSADRRDEDIQFRNLVRQRAVVSAALEAGVQRIVSAGSQAEFGPVEGWIADNHPVAPQSAYGRAKVAASFALASAAEEAGVEWVWARVFSVFGPLETGAQLFPSMAQAGRAGTRMQLSSGTQRWSYLYGADAGTAFERLASSPAASGFYNVGHPEAPELRRSIEVLASSLSPRPSVEFGTTQGVDLRPLVSRLTALGWEPVWRYSTALATTARWLNGDPVDDPLVDGILPHAPLSLER